MTNDPHASVRNKGEAILKELAGDRELRLRGPLPAQIVRDAIASACSADRPPKVADEIAFHMVDWSCDAAFVVALHLFPERFTPEEIEAGIGMFLAHAPAHV